MFRCKILVFLSLYYFSGVMSQKRSEVWIQPFTGSVDPMEKLLLINFEKDPDTVYIGFEPQMFDNASNGRGKLVIGWRMDGKVDVYHEPGIRPDPQKYWIAGNGLNKMQSLNFEIAELDITDTGIKTHFRFKDLYGRKIEFLIDEKNKKARKPFDMVAPMGETVANPAGLPLIFLYDFYFVRRSDTEFRILIDGKSHRPDKLPLPVDWSNMYFTRYSPKPLIFILNPDFRGHIEPVQINSLDDTIHLKDKVLFLTRQNGKHFLEKISFLNEIAPLEMLFDPPFPNLHEYEGENERRGEFKFISSAGAGWIAGTYSIQKEKDSLFVELTPSGGWKPRPSKVVLGFLYAIAKPFKNWPKKYRWKATVTHSHGQYYMESAWKRTE